MKMNSISIILLCSITMVACNDSKPDLGGTIYHGKNYITINQFADSLKKELDGRVIKYAFVVRHKLAITSREAGKKNTGTNNFTIDSKCNIASVTKTITAVAVLQLLEKKNLTLDEPVWRYLPATWNTSLIKNITFRQVLTHSAGFPNPPLADNVDYGDVWNTIEGGPNPVTLNNHDYKNINYGICRILVDFLDGYDPTAYANQEYGTGSYFINYLQKNIFDLIHVQNVSFTPQSFNTTLFFKNTHVTGDGEPGTDYGNWLLKPGSAGIQLSAKELSEFLFFLETDNKFISKNMRSQMESSKIGWDDINAFVGDEFLYKGGYFGDPRHLDPILESAIFHFKNGLEISIIVNGDPGHDAVRTAYEKAWNDSQH